MTFAEAMAEIAKGSAVRRAAWGPRRAIRVMPQPWWRDEDALLLFDRTGDKRVIPFPYCMTGEDVRGDDWEIERGMP